MKNDKKLTNKNEIKDLSQEVDLDALQKQLMSASGQPSEITTASSDVESNDSTDSKQEKAVVPKNDDAPTYKKFVIYINKDNVEYVESLTQEERNKVINRFFIASSVKSEEEIKKEKIKSYFIHGLIVIFTIVFCVPAFYALVNASYEITRNNYSISEQNIIKLYKSKKNAKILNPQDDTKAKNKN